MVRRRWVVWLGIWLPVAAIAMGSLSSCKTSGPVPAASPWVHVAGATYIDNSDCETCHDVEATALGKTKHGKKLDPRTPAASAHGCQSCHGPGSVHAAARQEGKPLDPAHPDLVTFKEGGPVPAGQRADVCLSCHQKMTKRNWTTTGHAMNGVACSDCHTVHNPKGEPQLKTETEVETCGRCHKDVKAQLQRPSHHPVREGKLTCSNCHNPHGSGNEKNLLKSNANDTCFQCHQEKRGPFLWEHPPVFENCLNCHNPHGTNNRNMLVSDTPKLCEQCHAASRHPDTLYDATAKLEGDAGLSGLAQNPNARMYNKGCNNCHSHIHGSNHPSGQFFLR